VCVVKYVRGVVWASSFSVWVLPCHHLLSDMNFRYEKFCAILCICDEVKFYEKNSQEEVLALKELVRSVEVNEHYTMQGMQGSKIEGKKCRQSIGLTVVCLSSTICFCASAFFPVNVFLSPRPS